MMTQTISYFENSGIPTKRGRSHRQQMTRLEWMPVGSLLPAETEVSVSIRDPPHLSGFSPADTLVVEAGTGTPTVQRTAASSAAARIVSGAGVF